MEGNKRMSYPQITQIRVDCLRGFLRREEEEKRIDMGGQDVSLKRPVDGWV